MTEWKEASFEKQNIWKPEDIITSEDVVKENIVPYWNSQDQLVPGLHYPIQQSGWLYYSNISLRSSGTWAQTITGVGFKPKMIKIKAYKWSGYVVSEWTATPTNSNSFSSYESAGNLFVTYGGNIIYLIDGSNASYCTVSSFDSDGFTLNWTLVQISTNFIYECYG